MGLELYFSTIGRIKGVHGYIVVDGKGNIMAHDMEVPGKLAKMVSSCGHGLLALGNRNFKYVSFSRKSKKNILIFPAGNSFLGVVKQSHVTDSETAEAVIKFLSVVEGKNGKA